MNLVFHISENGSEIARAKLIELILINLKSDFGVEKLISFVVTIEMT